MFLSWQLLKKRYFTATAIMRATESTAVTVPSTAGHVERNPVLGYVPDEIKNHDIEDPGNLASAGFSPV